MVGHIWHMGSSLGSPAVREELRLRVFQSGVCRRMIRLEKRALVRMTKIT
jgi:hypothetical protein